MKEIRLSHHAELKLELLANHGITLSTEFVTETIRSPDQLESEDEENLLLKSVWMKIVF